MINSLKLFSIIFETHELLKTYVHKMVWYALIVNHMVWYALSTNQQSQENGY